MNDPSGARTMTGPHQTRPVGWHGVGRKSALLAKGVTTVLQLARPLIGKKRDRHPDGLAAGRAQVSCGSWEVLRSAAMTPRAECRCGDANR